MKALTIQQPWLDAIVQPGDNPKRTENRSWTPPTALIGQRILLHSGKADDRRAILPFGFNTARGDWPDQRGVILAAATLVDYHLDGDGCGDPNVNCGLWGFREVFHWGLADVVALPEPVPCKGLQRFWTPPPAVLAAVQQQLAAVTA